MTLKEKIKTEPGFQYVVESLELQSVPGQNHMMSAPFLTSASDIEAEFDNLQALLYLMQATDSKTLFSEIRHHLSTLHDLSPILQSLHSHILLNEIELFEIKNFAFAVKSIANLCADQPIARIFNLPDVNEVFNLLDPDHTNIANFYIYDSYDPELPHLRKQLKSLSGPENASRYAEVFAQQAERQRQVEYTLSEKLWEHHSLIASAYERASYIDLLIAKADLSLRWGLCRPQLSGQTSYQGLYNPRLKHRNEQQNIRYQPIDITVKQGLCLITGANMAGKTVLLKTLGISQLMAQFGIFVPAQSATISIVEDVLFCIGDEQNEMNGLSSFASEIIKISNTIQQSAEHNLLILIDEPARTTNPTEGKAIVQALAQILNSRSSLSLITTHYGQLDTSCRRLRVKGFVEDLANIPLSPENINQFMDYSLIEDTSAEVPHEALRIATLLNADTQLLAIANRLLETAK